MRIGLVCDAFVPENKAVAIRMGALAAAFQRRKQHVIVMTCTTPPSEVAGWVKRNWMPGPSNESGAVVRLASEVLLGFELFFRVLFSRFDLVIVSSPPFFSSFLAVVPCILRRVPYVIDVRDEYPEVYFAAGLTSRSSFPGRILLWMEKFLYRHAFLVVTVTTGICDRIRKKAEGVQPYLLRNGFEESIFKPSSEKEKIFTLVFHGNIGKFQDPALIIALAEGAIKSNLPIRIWVVGKGNNDAIVRQAKLPNLEYVGEMDYRDIPSFIGRAHVGISFRVPGVISQNAFPVKLFEYIGVGLPMLVTPICEAGDLVEQYEMGFQFPGTQLEPILMKVKELCENGDLLAKLSANVQRHRLSFSREEGSNLLVDFLLGKVKRSHD